MSELFGVSSPDKICLNGLLEEFFSHGKEHPHGWGVALFGEDGDILLEKRPEASYKSDYLRQILGLRIEAKDAIAHIRIAERETVAYANTHPFVASDVSGRTWTLAHDGIIYDCAALDPYVYRQRGHTDSERILMYLTDTMNAEIMGKGIPLSKEERFRIVDTLIGGITAKSRVNLLIFDGELLYAHTNCRGTLFCSKKDGALLISTTPLDDGKWDELPLNTMAAFKDGSIELKGHARGSEYFA